jgi:hypothetical protein
MTVEFPGLERVLSVSIVSFTTIFRKIFGTFPAVCYFCFVFNCITTTPIYLISNQEIELFCTQLTLLQSIFTDVTR